MKGKAFIRGMRHAYLSYTSNVRLKKKSLTFDQHQSQTLRLEEDWIFFFVNRNVIHLQVVNEGVLNMVDLSGADLSVLTSLLTTIIYMDFFKKGKDLKFKFYLS